MLLGLGAAGGLAGLGRVALQRRASLCLSRPLIARRSELGAASCEARAQDSGR